MNSVLIRGDEMALFPPVSKRKFEGGQVEVLSKRDLSISQYWPLLE